MQTPEGARPIETLKVSDTVLTYNEKTSAKVAGFYFNLAWIEDLIDYRDDRTGQLWIGNL